MNTFNKRKLNKFLGGTAKLEFGDYILFQKYTEGKPDDSKEDYYEISTPILAIYLGCFVCDQTLGFNYVRWNNDNHSVFVTTESGYKCRTLKEVERIENHIEWNDYIDILGHWDFKPKYRNILKAYRTQNTQQNINSDEIEWDS
ncbi:hypothetical protein KA001_03580 [Patescibacteria group bacterium]|nr:hypothetical protein [Patescibacteria group bacterium]